MPAKKKSSFDFKKWGASVKKARKDLKIEGFCPVGGKTALGKKLYKKTKEHYEKATKKC